MDEPIPQIFKKLRSDLRSYAGIVPSNLSVVEDEIEVILHRFQSMNVVGSFAVRKGQPPPERLPAYIECDVQGIPCGSVNFVVQITADDIYIYSLVMRPSADNIPTIGKDTTNTTAPIDPNDAWDRAMGLL